MNRGISARLNRATMCAAIPSRDQEELVKIFRSGALLAVLLGLAHIAAAADAAPTFAKDVAPILYSHCVECHRPTMFAPMSLVKYEEARPYAQVIKRRVVARQMPPWNADPAIGHFKNDPRLTDQEIDTIARWVDRGAPRGNDRDLPPLPALAEGWTIGKPDAVFAMAAPFRIPANGAVEYQYVRIPVNLPEDRWIQAIEIKPGARAQVHHVIAYTQPSGEPISERGVLGPTNIGGVTPNKPGMVFPDGVARLIRGGHDIILQMHYTTNGTEALDRTEVGVIFAPRPPAKAAAGGLVINPRFVIPPNDGNFEVRGVARVMQDTVLTSMTPHMHVRGKDMTYIAQFPDGRTETLLSVPHYDFNWQITYELAEPIVLPRGTRLEVIAHFDNSPGNKFNPDPSQAVRWGDQTWEEMMIVFYGVVRDLPA
jgi:mono/diheme cytochrome c family protein